MHSHRTGTGWIQTSCRFGGDDFDSGIRAACSVVLTGLGPGAASGFARMIDPRAAPTGAISTPRTYPGGVVRKSRPAPVRVTPWSMGRGLMELGSSGTAIP